MTQLKELIQHMQQSTMGGSLSDTHLRLIQSGAGRIAQAMTAQGMAWVDANQIWQHVIGVAAVRNVSINMPSIADPQLLTAEALNGDVAYVEGKWTQSHAGHANWSEKAKQEQVGRDSRRWL